MSYRGPRPDYLKDRDETTTADRMKRYRIETCVDRYEVREWTGTGMRVRSVGPMEMLGLWEKGGWHGRVVRGFNIMGRVLFEGSAFQCYRVNRKTPAYFRMIAAGFTVGEITLPIKEMDDDDMRTCPFTCVCGRQEVLHFRGISRQYIANQCYVDIAQMVEDIGSTGLKHLRDDGFPPEAIRQIRRAYL